jgi:hypothetical protein
MWWRRQLAVVSAVAVLAGVDAFVASRAGAALEPIVPPSALVGTTSPRQKTSTTRRSVPSTTTVPRRRAPTRTRRPVKPTAPVRPAKPPAPPAQPQLAASRPPVAPPVTVPTNCAAVVASIVWPPGWNAICAGPRSGLLGLTAPTGTTTLYVRTGETSAFLRVVALHESGHAWNFARLDANKIAQWCTARGCDAAHFFSGGAQGAGWSEPGGAEDWAASWDACHGGEYHRSYLGLPPPSAALCALQNALVGYPA